MDIKKLFRHNKNRDKQMAIVAKKTEEAQKARVEGKLVMSNDTLSRHASQNVDFKAQAMRQAGLASTEVTQENVSRACVAMHTQIRLNGNGEGRKQVLIHLPAEIRNVFQGRTTQEVYDFYWSLEAFRTVWPELGFDETDLKVLINQQAKFLDKEML